MKLIINIATFDFLEKYDIFGYFADANFQLKESDFVNRIQTIGMESHNSLVNLNTIAVVLNFIILRILLALICELLLLCIKSERLRTIANYLWGDLVMN